MHALTTFPFRYRCLGLVHDVLQGGRCPPAARGASSALDQPYPVPGTLPKHHPWTLVQANLGNEIVIISETLQHSPSVLRDFAVRDLVPLRVRSRSQAPML